MSTTIIGQKCEIEQVRVAQISFAYDNSELIKLLKERGEAIMSQEYESIKKIDNKINNLKNEKPGNLIRPCSAFITFETKEGYNHALNFSKIIK